MTRLREDDVKSILRQLAAYDDELLKKTGRTLRGLGCLGAGLDEDRFCRAIDNVKIAVVPISSGEGILNGFTEAVGHIVSHLGIETIVTVNTDVAGIAEAAERKVEAIFMADEQQFIALNIRKGRMVDNTEATAKGFAAGLELMAGGLAGHEVLVLGCGPLGRYAVMEILNRGASVAVFDVVPQRSEALAKEMLLSKKQSIKIETDVHSALANHRLLFDATNTADVIGAEDIYADTFIAAPGMPLGLTPAAEEKIAGRLLHDALRIGVAVMAVDAVWHSF